MSRHWHAIEATDNRNGRTPAPLDRAAIMDETYTVDVPAGGSARLVYTFDQPGTLQYGCHVADHYAAGMRATITIS